MNQRLGLVSFLTVVFAVGVIGRPVWAFTPGACRDDEKKFCGDMSPEARRDCMKQHAADLSGACKENISEGKAKFEEKRAKMQAACKDDIKQFCANVTPGEGREIACLHAYDDKISAACKDQMPKPGMHNGMPPQGDHEAPQQSN